MLEKKTFKILSIDGGGIRGIMPAKILAEMEASLIRRGEISSRLYEYFDLICGTSTGSIIALGLALGVPASKILSLYMENATVIFPKKNRFSSWLGKLSNEPFYDLKSLEEILKKAFSDYSPNGDTRLAHAKTRVCVPTFNSLTGCVNVYKTPHHPELQRDYLIPAHDVVLSSAAAPLFFKPHTFSYKCPISGCETSIINNIDGGIFANNPSLIGLMEAMQALEVKRENIKLLSLGTGSVPFRASKMNKKFGLYYWVSNTNIIEAIYTSQASHTDNLIKFMNSGIGTKNEERFLYKRLQYDFEEKDKIALDETNPHKLSILNGYASELYKRECSCIQEHFLNEKRLYEYEPCKTL